MNIIIDNSHRHPQLLARKEGLLGGVFGRVERQLHHAQPGAQGGRVDVPAEVWLVRVGLGDLLHKVESALVQLEGEGEGLGDGLVGYVVVAGAS